MPKDLKKNNYAFQEYFLFKKEQKKNTYNLRKHNRESIILTISYSIAPATVKICCLFFRNDRMNKKQVRIQR